MPTYDYRCATCGTSFELFQSFSEDALKKCPTKKSGNSPAACTNPGRGRVEKVFSAPGITFKGSGFYKTDSRPAAKSKTKADAKTGESTSSDAGSSDSSSSGDSSRNGSGKTSPETKSSDGKAADTKNPTKSSG